MPCTQRRRQEIARFVRVAGGDPRHEQFAADGVQQCGVAFDGRLVDVVSLDEQIGEGW